MEFKNHIKKHKGSYLVILLWLIITLPNLSKPFHIDDTFHLEAAQHIINNPTHPMSGEINSSGETKPIHQFNQPPLFFYCISATIYCFGPRELPLHLMLSLFTFLSLYFFRKILLLKKIKEVNFALLVFALCPALILNQNLMVDVPLLSMVLASVFFFLKQDKTYKNILFSILFLSTALLIKYSALPVLAAFVIYIIVNKNYKHLLFLSIPVFTLALWSIWNYAEYGGIHLLSRSHSSFDFNNIAVFLSCIGAVFFVLIFNKNKNNLIYISTLTGAFLSIYILSLIQFITIETTDLLMNIVFLVNGLIILVRLFYTHLRSNDKWNDLSFILLICISLFIILFAPFIATRHILLIIPFILILTFQHTTNLQLKSKIAFALITSLISSSLVIDDWKYANYYKTEAQSIPTEYNGKIWTIGHWGWQWYSRQNGMKVYDLENSMVKNGDLLIFPGDIAKQPFDENIKIELLEKRFSIEKPLLLISGRKHASFYNSFINRPPWTFSRQPFDTIYVYKVQ